MTEYMEGNSPFQAGGSPSRIRLRGRRPADQVRRHFLFRGAVRRGGEGPTDVFNILPKKLDDGRITDSGADGGL